MSSGPINTVEISLGECATRSVTLGPQRATIVRELRDLHIKVGPIPSCHDHIIFYFFLFFKIAHANKSLL